MSPSAKVTILCSGVHLGVYVPGLLVETGLRQLGVEAEVETLESYYKPAERQGLEQLREAYHRDFRFALMARRMTHDIRPSLDDDLLAEALERWRREGRRRFIMWSGFWLPVMVRYRGLVGDRIRVDHCRIDAVVSPSFEVYPELDGEGRAVWFWNRSEGRLEHRVPVNCGPLAAFKQRDDRYVVHGGGWGVGTYRDKVPELHAAGLGLDIIAYGPDEIERCSHSDRVFMMEPGWRAWATVEGGRHQFPPFGRVAPGPAEEFRQPANRHGLFDLIARSRAVISKPGGGTLIDSLEAATPLVILEPYGGAEEANGELWERLGLGISYDSWRASGFSTDPLERCHERLLEARRQTPDYCRVYADELRRGPA